MSLREIANLLKLCGFGGFAKNKRILSSQDSALINLAMTGSFDFRFK